MLAHNAGQLKHRHLRLAKHGQQLGVGVDGAFVGGVLQVVGFDVVPQLLDHLGAQDLLAANHGGQASLGFKPPLAETLRGALGLALCRAVLAAPSSLALF